MTTIAKADKSRLTIRGLRDGHRYLIQQVQEGWFVVPEPEIKVPRRPRTWHGPKADLSKHLENLAAEGLTFERTMDKEASSCRF